MHVLQHFLPLLQDEYSFTAAHISVSLNSALLNFYSDISAGKYFFFLSEPSLTDAFLSGLGMRIKSSCFIFKSHISVIIVRLRLVQKFFLNSCLHLIRVEVGGRVEGWRDWTSVPRSDLHDWRRVMSICAEDKAGWALASPLNLVECQNIKGRLWEIEMLRKGLNHAQRFERQPFGGRTFLTVDNMWPRRQLGYIIWSWYLLFKVI